MSFLTSVKSDEGGGPESPVYRPVPDHIPLETGPRKWQGKNMKLHLHTWNYPLSPPPQPTTAAAGSQSQKGWGSLR